MTKRDLGGRLALLLAAMIWGSAFFVMKNAVDSIPTWMLLGIRFTMGAGVLALIFWKRLKLIRASTWARGAALGVLLCAAYGVQTFGLMDTTPGKNAFLTTVYCILVPFLNWALLGRRPTVYNGLAAVLCLCAPAALAADDAAVSGGAVTMGGANTTLIPAEEENCLSWLFGSGDTITLPYLNIRGQGLKKNVTLNLVDCLVGITYNELGSIGSYVSASAAQQAWKAQAVAAHSYLEYHKQYGSSANALVYTPVDQIPSAAREAIRKAVEPVKDEILTYNGSACDAVWSASAGYNTQTGVYGTCSSRDAWGTEVPYLQSVESPYEEQYHNLLRRSIGKDYTYVEYNDSRTGEPYTDADTTHKSLGGYVQYNTFVSNGRSYRYIGQFVSSRYCFDFGTDENGTPCMTYYGFGHGVGMSQCGAVGYAAERNMGYKAILRHYYKGASITSQGSSGGLFGWLRSLFG